MTRFRLTVWLVLLGLALVPVTNQATLLTNSTQLDLHGNLAAVHFYYNSAPSYPPATT